MNHLEFQSTIDRLGYSQVAISRLFGVTDRTGRRWASGEVQVPIAVQMILRRMLNDGLTVDVSARIIAARLGGELGAVDKEQFLWVRPRTATGKWQVAKRDNQTGHYYLTGSSSQFSAHELDLGPLVHLDVPEEIAEQIPVLGRAS